MQMMSNVKEVTDSNADKPIVDIRPMQELNKLVKQ